jgi:hypothetical protein
LGELEVSRGEAPRGEKPGGRVRVEENRWGVCKPVGKLFNAHALPLSGYYKNHLGFITYILKLTRVLHNITKT